LGVSLLRKLGHDVIVFDGYESKPLEVKGLVSEMKRVVGEKKGESHG
jgi:hypothetical protein